MSERLTKCPLCKSGHFLNHSEVTDFAVSKETFVLCKCTKCDLLFTNPRPDQSEIGPYYEFPQYFSHDDQSKSLTQWVYNKARKRNIQNKISLIQSLLNTGSWLDYGCGTGELLYAAQENGWKVSGVEPNQKARSLATNKLNKSIKSELSEIKSNKKFDIITLFHVLEHIHELKSSLKTLIKHLNSKGYILIAIPNPESFDAKKYGKFWAGWDVPRHLYHFSRSAMIFLEKEFDLELIEEKPMKMDSYYVSMLSETYLDKNISTLKKFWNGFRSGLESNNSAKNSKNYSSTIYIFKKK